MTAVGVNGVGSRTSLSCIKRWPRQDGRFLLQEARAEFGSWLGDVVVLFRVSTALAECMVQKVT